MVDSYPSDFRGPASIGDHYEQPGQLPQTCDVKEALIQQLQQLDVKVFQLDKSNRLIMQELRDDPEKEEYIAENEAIIARSKHEILGVLGAFVKAGVDLEKEVYPALKHRQLWMGGDKDKASDSEERGLKGEEEKEEEPCDQVYI